MENVRKLILPCAHSFCEKCVHPILGRSPMKWRQHPDITIAVVWNVIQTHLIDKVNAQIGLSLHWMFAEIVGLITQRFQTFSQVRCS